MKRTALDAGRGPKPKIEQPKVLSSAQVEALKHEIASPHTNDPFARGLQSELISAGISPKAVLSAQPGELPKELEGRVNRALAQLRRELKPGKKLELSDLSRNLQGFLESLGGDQPREKPLSDQTPTHELASVGETNQAPAPGLAPIRTYYPESGVLPKFSGTAVTFDEAQARFFFRQYWDGPPNISLADVVKKAAKDDAFPALKKRLAAGGELSQEEVRELADRAYRMMRKLRASFPWPWTGRTQVFCAHALLKKLETTPAHVHVNAVIAELAEIHAKDGGFPPPDNLKQNARGAWLENPKDDAGRPQFRFLEAWPKAADGSFALEGRQPAAAIARDSHGRLSITPALAAAVDKLAEDREVKWGWTREQFVEYVSEKLGGFTVNTFESLLQNPETKSHLRSWTEMKKSAAARLVELIKSLHRPAHESQPGIDTATAMVEVLSREHGYPKFDLKQLDYLRSYYELDVPEFKVARSERAREGAEPPKEPGTPKARYTEEEVQRLGVMAEEQPIGAKAAEIYERLQTEDPEFCARHPLAESRSIGPYVLQAVGHESWADYQHQRLGVLLEQVKREAPRASTKTWVAMLRTKAEIRYSDEHILSLIRNNKPTPVRVPVVSTPIGAEAPAPVVASPALVIPSAAAPSAGSRSALASAFAAWYPEAEKLPNAPYRGLTVAQANAVHEIYWALEPNEGYAEIFARLTQRFGAASYSEKDVRSFIASRSDCFPSDPRLRSFDFHSYLLVEELRASPVTDSLSTVVDRLRARHGHFPHQVQFRTSAKDTWVRSPSRFPFLGEGTRLPLRPDGEGYDLRGQVGQSDLAVIRGSQLVYSEELAKAFEKLCFDPRIRYDWDKRRLLEFVSKELGVELTVNRLLTMRRSFDVPDLTDIRNTAKRNLATLIRELHSGEANGGVPLLKLEDVLDVLHEKFGYPRFSNSILSNLRLVPADEKRGLPSGRDIVPEFREVQRANILAAAKQLLEEINRAPDQGFFPTGRRLGFSERQIIKLLRAIRIEWPEALPLVNDQYSKEEIDHIRTAVAESPIGAKIADVQDILQAQHPEIFERHESPGLGALLSRHLGIKSLRDTQESRLREVFAHVAKRSSPGVSLDEIYEVIQNNYDVSFPRVTFDRLVAKWSANSQSYPEIEALRGPRRSNFPWQEPRGLGFATQNGTPATESTLTPLQVAQKILEVAAGTANKAALTPTRLSLQLALPVTEVLTALRTHSSMFPWHRTTGGNIDLNLAAKVGQAIESARLGDTLEDIHETLWSDPEFRARYPSFSRETFSELRQRFPTVVPDWNTRQQVLASKTLVEQLLTAPKVTPASIVLHRLKQLYPYAYPSAEPQYYMSLWRENRELFAFTDVLRAGGKTIQFKTFGQPPNPAELETYRTEANRLAKEIPLVPTDLPVSRQLIDGVSKDQLRNSEVVCIQHLLGGMVPFMDICKEIGLEPSQTTIVGVPYSTNDTVVDLLEEKGWDVRSPPLDLKVWKESVREALYDRLDAAIKNGRQIVVMDDGGWAAYLLREDPYLRDYASMFSIVEQTTRGITVADAGDLYSPLTSVAESLTKRYVESHLLKDVLYNRLQKRLDRMGIHSVKGMRVGLVGKGALGSPIAEELRRQGAIVTIRDLDGTVVKEAVEAGFGDGSDAKKFFGGQDMILGVTGKESIGAKELAMVGNKTILGSFSSKLVEIDVGNLGDNAVGPPTTIDDQSRPPTVLYKMKDGREIRLLASGFPINFDGDVNSLDPIAVQVTRSLMLIGLLQASGKQAGGVARLDVARQIKLLDLLLKVELFREDPSTLSIIEETRQKLVESLKTGAHSPRPKKKGVPEAR